jgi:histidinol-phosphate aminotransferase
MSRFLRPSLASAPPYVPGEQITGMNVKLNTNESPYPPSPRVAEAIAAAAARLNRYPRPDADAARFALANRLGLGPDEVFVGNGSDEILRMAFTAWVEPGATVAWSTPTYTLYAILAGFAGAEIVDVPRAADFSVPIKELAAVDASLTIIANPNSPTGTVTPIEEIERLAASCRLLLVDEAYADFAGWSAAALVRRFENLVVARTLSKSYALAGLRVGFACAAPGLIADLRRLKDSYNVGLLADAGAAAAIEDEAHTAGLVNRILETRARLEAGLRRLGWTVQPSGANFVFALPPDRNGRGAYERLRERGVLVRWLPGEKRVEEGVRITVGTDAEIERLLKEIEKDV